MQVVAEPIKFYTTSSAKRFFAENWPVGHRKWGFFRVLRHYEKCLLKRHVRLTNNVILNMIRIRLCAFTMANQIQNCWACSFTALVE